MAKNASLPPVVSGARPVLGHTREFLAEPDALVARGMREHGEVFTLKLLGKPTIVLLGEEHTKFLFAETDKRLSIQDAYRFFIHMFDKNVYFLAPHELYLMQRDIVLPRFAGKEMPGYLQVMENEFAAFIDGLGSKGEFDLVDDLGPVVLRIAAASFMGADVGARMGTLFEDFRLFSAGLDPLVPGWVPAPHLVRSHRARDRLRKAVAEMLAERRQRPVDPPDFLQMLSGATWPDGTPVPDVTLVNLILLLIWVGHETTTGHLAWGLVDLLQNPDELHRVREEQRVAGLVPDFPLTVRELRSLGHLDRALHETERLHPVVASLMRRARQPLEYGGYHIPKGAILMTHPGQSHRLPGDFPEPDRFRPDRFIEDPSGLRKLIGFGGGAHRCLGTHFAYVEMKLAVTRLLQHLDLELVGPTPSPVVGVGNKWPQTPCRVAYRKKINAARAA